MKIGVIQLQSVLDPKHNLETIRRFLQLAVNEKAKAVFSPEVFYSMSDGTKATPFLIEGHNEHYQAIRQLAQESGLFILDGSAATLVNGKILNLSYNFKPAG